MNEPILALLVEETAARAREREPVTQGAPFPRGVLVEPTGLQMFDEAGLTVPLAAVPLARWPDGSIKWMLFDFQASLPARGKKYFRICAEAPESKASQKETTAALELTESREEVSVGTGDLEFILEPARLLPFRQIVAGGRPVLRAGASRLRLVDAGGREWLPRIDRRTIAFRNPLRLVLACEGSFVSGDNVPGLRYACQMHFFAGKSMVRMDFTLRNPQSARHPGGVWDLGDPGSIFFRELSLELATAPAGSQGAYYALAAGEPVQSVPGNILIYQDSSGGANWRSHNHVNRQEKIPVTFQGFEVRAGQRTVARGLRATPSIGVAANGVSLAVSVKHFWQNFPKALAWEADNLKIHLFPGDFKDVFELQGGEQKTHTLYFQIQAGELPDGAFDWGHHPLLCKLAPEWYDASKACPKPVPFALVAADEHCAAYQGLVDLAVRGERSFFARREIIDEYGWRNFGDLYADHEAVLHQSDTEFVSHYNNQYDVIKGALIQFMRTGEPAWFQLADDLARHVADIDIYHTTQDRYEYNGGLFWHTDHHLDAATSTHRCVSRKHGEFKDPRFLGGGPAAAHNYATGLLYHYWLTGDCRSKAGVLTLTENIVHLLEGSDILLERGLAAGKIRLKWLLSKLRPGGERDYEFDGPGRASGNALNTLLDGYLLCAEARYLACAESLIRRCVTPEDNIADRDLLHAELRWMYTIFFQALGKYLDLKREIGQLDQAFWYARTVLLKYAEWMAEHEYPYLDKSEDLEFPNETWSAQEIRKSDILAQAAQYAPEPLRQRLLEKSRFFFEVCLNQLRDWETRDLTRVLVILMSNGMAALDALFRFTCAEEIASKPLTYVSPPAESGLQKYGWSERFAPFIQAAQKTSFKQELRWLRQRLGSKST